MYVLIYDLDVLKPAFDNFDLIAVRLAELQQYLSLK